MLCIIMREAGKEAAQATARKAALAAAAREPAAARAAAIRAAENKAEMAKVETEERADSRPQDMPGRGRASGTGPG